MNHLSQLRHAQRQYPAISLRNACQSNLMACGTPVFFVPSLAAWTAKGLEVLQFRLPDVLLSLLHSEHQN